MYLDERAVGNRSTRDKSPEGLLQSLNTIIAMSGVSMSTRFLSLNTLDFCYGIKILLQKKQAGNKSDKILKKSML